jgi:glycosyltransferase involved in cell wall biosynthesis
MENNSPYILWLPSWYPCRLTPYDGDFIQRHAQAVSAFIPVHVFHIIRDKTGTVTKNVFIEEKQTGNLKETIIYYYSRNSFFKILDSILSIQKYTRLYKKSLKDHFSVYGLPPLVHVHIAFKAGMIARWIRKKIGIEYLLTEQWTVYLEEAKPNFRQLSFSSKYFISKIINDASLILPVSQYLAGAIQRRWPSAECEVVPNVVNTEIFNPAVGEKSDMLRLIHISTLSYQKDPESLFEAAGILKKRGIGFYLEIAGPVSDYIKTLIKKENIEENINLRGEIPQQDLAGLIKNSDALVLYSRYETFGCVLIEANACGIPVIVPDTRLMHELVENGVNGILVHPASSIALANTLIEFSKTKNNFLKNKIAADTAEKYSYSRVGKMYSEIYSRFINA